MRVKKQLLSWPILIIYFIFLIGVFFVVKNAFAQVSSCPGLASTQPSPDGNYKATAFGIVDEWADPGDAPYAPAYGNPPEYCSAEMSGPECEKKIRWFAANGDIFGKWKKLLVTRPDTGRSVVVLTIDRGPACDQELTKGPLIDLSYAAAVIYLGNGEGGNYETVSVKPVADDTPLGPTDESGITTLPNVGNGTTSGGGSGSYTLTLKVRLKPGTKDTYLINRATAQAIGGSGTASGLGQGAPPGSVDGQCTPTGAYPSDPTAELQSKYKISTAGYSSDGVKMIYELATCLSPSQLPSLIGKPTTVHNAISPTLDGIGMDCDATCNIWIPEETNAFKFILTHEFGHVLYYTNPSETMHVSDAENAWSSEGGLSPYSGPYYGGQGSCPTKGAVEDYAEMVAYYLNPTMGGKTGACDSRDNPKNSLFEDSHFPLHLNVAKQVL